MKPILLLFFIMICMQVQGQIQWPDHKKSAIILTYDDALAHQELIRYLESQKKKYGCLPFSEAWIILINKVH